jgi:hypothetical protein
MRFLISIIFILAIVGIAASVQSGNSTNQSLAQDNIGNNVTIQTNNSTNQTNISNMMSISDQTNISITSSKSVLGGDSMNGTAIQTPLKAIFKSEPVSLSGNAAARAWEEPAMETPSQAAFGAYVI